MNKNAVLRPSSLCYLTSFNIIRWDFDHIITNALCCNIFISSWSSITTKYTTLKRHCTAMFQCFNRRITSEVNLKSGKRVCSWVWKFIIAASWEGVKGLVTASQHRTLSHVAGNIGILTSCLPCTSVPVFTKQTRLNLGYKDIWEGHHKSDGKWSHWLELLHTIHT